METMKSHIDNLMSMIKAQPVAKSGAELSVKLVALKDYDDIESYLITFERIMAAHKVGKERWPHYLAPQLAGKAQLAFAALSITEVGEYEANAIRYNINEEAYSNRFRTEKRKDGETNREFSVRLMDLLQKWMKGKTSVDEIQQVIGMEQFLNSLPLEKRLWLVERKPGSCVAAGELVDEFEQTRRSVAEGKLPAGSEYPTSVKKAVQCAYCDKSDHVEEDCRRKKEDMGGRSSGPSMRVHEMLPVSADWTFVKELKEEQKVFRQGMIEGKMVTVLLDTGCSRTMVRRNLVPEHKLIEGKGVAIRCAHGDTTFYPLAEIGVEISGRNFKVEAAVADNLPVQLLLGTDVPQLFKLLGREEPELANVDDALVVMTRAKARQQIEERIQQKEKEIASGTKSQLVEVKATVDGTGPRKGAGEPSCGLGLPNETGYFKEDGVLYRRWVPTGRPEMSIEQLVLPKRCRGTVLEMAHEIPISGLQGKEKTRQRVLRRFFWPSVYKDIEDYSIPPKSIDAEHIAEMIEVFARVGVPREILTDQGSNFVSQLLAELYRLLQVKPIRTSPYHPQTDGLVERFNKTLKAMLRKSSAMKVRPQKRIAADSARFPEAAMPLTIGWDSQQSLCPSGQEPCTTNNVPRVEVFSSTI
eukprot:Em0001g2993a